MRLTLAITLNPMATVVFKNNQKTQFSEQNQQNDSVVVPGVPNSENTPQKMTFV